MGKTEMIKIIDIGTSKISLITGKLDGRNLGISFIDSFGSSGIKKGRIIDMEALSNSIKRAINDFENKSNIKIKKASVCFSCTDVKGYHSSSKIKVRKRTITEEDVNFAIETASAVILPSDREIIHVLPVDFKVDENSGIKDPVGMKGLSLEANVYVVTASSNQIHNLITCCNKAGIEVEEIILQGIASSEAVLSNHDKDFGSIVIDIGSGTTDLAIFYDGYIRHLSNFPIAGNHITNDLSIGLKISYSEAERIKKDFATLIPDSAFLSQTSKLQMIGKVQENMNNSKSPHEIEVIGPDRKPFRIPLAVIREIVYARAEEIIEEIKNHINSAQQDTEISSVVLTGGSSLLQGFNLFSESLLSLPARIGRPDTGLVALISEIGLEESSFYENEFFSKYFSPEFSSLIGAFIYKVREEIYGSSNSEANGLIEKFKKWINNFINK